jgi:tetratricopeptide (TPR) repeat protein
MGAVRVGNPGRSLLWLSLIVPVVALASGGGSMDTGSMPSPRMSPAEMAKQEYNQGVSAVNAAKKYEEAAAGEAKPEKKEKLQQKTRKQYEKARAAFADAVRGEPRMFEAWNYVGFTSRKLGEYDKSLLAYDEALRLNPAYAEAIEYRGHAYLGLNRLEDAKAAYMSLFRDARPLADQLMGAMKQWVADRRSNAAGVAGADVESFASWVEERGVIASQTASLGEFPGIQGTPARWE